MALLAFFIGCATTATAAVVGFFGLLISISNILLRSYSIQEQISIEDLLGPRGPFSSYGVEHPRYLVVVPLILDCLFCFIAFICACVVLGQGGSAAKKTAGTFTLFLCLLLGSSACFAYKEAREVIKMVTREMEASMDTDGADEDVEGQARSLSRPTEEDGSRPRGRL